MRRTREGDTVWSPVLTGEQVPTHGPVSETATESEGGPRRHTVRVSGTGRNDQHRKRDTTGWVDRRGLRTVTYCRLELFEDTSRTSSRRSTELSRR